MMEAIEKMQNGNSYVDASIKNLRNKIYNQKSDFSEEIKTSENPLVKSTVSEDPSLESVTVP